MLRGVNIISRHRLIINFSGVGRGIALELGRAGATVYTTALELSKEDSVVQSVASKLPTLDQTVNEVNIQIFSFSFQKVLLIIKN